MKTQIVAFAVASFAALNSFSSPIWAQIKAWNPSCAQVLALGYDRFAEEYEKHTHDDSTAGMVAPATRYSKCKDAANAQHLQTLPAARRARVQNAQTHLVKLEDALWPMALAQNGGGTMYAIFAASSAAHRSDMMGKFIVATQRAKRSNPARSQANLQWRRAWNDIKRWEIAPANDVSGLAEYKMRYNIVKRELSNLEVLGARLPDEAALIIARRVANSVTDTYPHSH